MLTNEEFNALMQKTFEIKKSCPNLPTLEIVNLACEGYQDLPADEFDTLVFQVTMNLVNAFR